MTKRGHSGKNLPPLSISFSSQFAKVKQQKPVWAPFVHSRLRCSSSCSVSPLHPACSGECVLFQGRAASVIYGLLSASQRLLLEKSRRGAVTSLFRPDPVVSGAERAQFEALFPSSILLKRVSLGFFWMRAPAGPWTGVAVRVVLICIRAGGTEQHRFCSSHSHCPHSACEMELRVNLTAAVCSSRQVCCLVANHPCSHAFVMNKEK